MIGPIMIRPKAPRPRSRLFAIALTSLISLSLIFTGTALAAVGVNPPGAPPGANDYAGGNWAGTASADDYTNDGTVNGNVNLNAGNDLFTNNGTVTGTVNGGNWHDQLINNATGTIGNWFRGGNGNDTLTNLGSVGTSILGEAGNDTIFNSGTTPWIQGGTGDDTITNTGTVTTSINGDEDNDTITNSGSVANVIDGGDGDDNITNSGSVTTIRGGAGDDTITTSGHVTGNIAGQDGMDHIIINGRVDGDILGGNGGDTIWLNAGASVGGTINGGGGSDAIIFDGVADTSAFNIVSVSHISYEGNSSLSGTHSAPGADLAVHGTLRLQNGTVNADSLKVWPAGAALTGNGNIACPLTVQMQGSVAPGNSIGTISVDTLEILWDSSYNVEVGGAASDQIIVATRVTLTSAILKVSLLSAPITNQQYTIIRNDGAEAVHGTLFNGLPEGARFKTGGYLFSISYQGGDGNDVVLTALPSDDQPTEPDPAPTPNPPAAPSVPQGQSPSPTGSLGGPGLSWPHVAGSNFYRVYRASCPTCPKTQVGRVPDTSFTDQSAQPGQVYYYWVKTENGGGLSDFSNWMAAWRYEQNPGRAGDFNGDGIMDLLWWDPATNQLSIWYMNGGAVQSVGSPGEGLDLSQWLLVNTGDFNNDGIWDLLWWNPETGVAQVWFMSATASTASGGMTIQATAEAGDILGNVTLSYSGDLNGDGLGDILWRDYNTGQVTIWLMGPDGKPQLSGPPTLAEGMTDGGKPGVTDSLDWTIRGLHDMDGDNKAEVVWQHATNGKVVVWRMDGSQAIGLEEYQRSEPANWRIVGLGDLNADGRGDMVWRNDVSSAVQVWLMTGGDPAFEQRDLAMGDNAASWSVKAVGDFCSAGCDDVYCKSVDSNAARIVNLDGQEFNPSVE